MPQRKTIIWTVAAIAFLSGVVYFSVLRQPKAEYNTLEAKKGELASTVSVTGTLKASDTVNLDFETTGRVQSVEVRVGQKVGKGDVIGILDNTSLELSLDQARANLEKARADAGANSDSIHSAEVGKENAEKYLDDTKSLNKKNVAAAEQKVSDTREYHEDAQEYLEKVRDESGADSAAAKLAQLTVDTAEANYEQAQDALDVADQTADLAETSAQNSLDAAEASLDAAESTFVRASKDATVSAYEAAYQKALDEMGKAVLRAPAAGMIKQVNYKVGEVIGATTADPFARMISYDFILEAKVPESDIAKVKIGQKGAVAFDAFSADEKFSATVVSIDPSATVVQDVVDYVVKLTMDADDRRLKDGMSADIDILLGKKDGVISIPQRAVREENGKNIVQILEKGRPADREVELGMEGDGGMVEVLSGLSEGDLVITSTK